MEKLIDELNGAWRKADATARGCSCIDRGDRFSAGMKHGKAIGISMAIDIVRSYDRMQNVHELEFAFGPLETWLPPDRALEMRSDSAAGVVLNSAMAAAIGCQALD